jgi:anti-sigma regulatory factor (Ser/Thr protein kinase)
MQLSNEQRERPALTPVNYEMSSLINDTVLRSILYPGGKPIAFELDLDENLPARLLGDEQRIRQILNELLSYAFTYTREGQVTLKIRCERGAKGIWMTYSVSDTGMGIREEDIDGLFGECGGPGAGNIRPNEGAGLGLAVTKRLAEMMGGAMYVKSEYGRGTTFMVRLFQGFVSDELVGKEQFLNGDELQSLREVETSLRIADLIRAAALEGLDCEKGLEYFFGDGKSYQESLRSYAAHTPVLLEAIRTVGTLEDHAVTVRRIKNSSYAISADGIGLKAERLEYAARNGNLAFVEAENDRFAGALEKFLVRLTDLLDTLDSMWPDPRPPAPDMAPPGRGPKTPGQFDLVAARKLGDAAAHQFDWPIGA